MLQEFIQQKLQITEPLPFDIHERHYKQGEEVIHLGMVEENIYFLVEGIVKGSVKVNGEEKILDFTFPSEFFASLTSVLKKTASDVYATCITDCTIQWIVYAKLNEACKTSLVTCKLHTYFLELFYITRVKKEKELLSKDAKQRYAELIKTRPTILQHVNIGQIAKYLGIQPNSLSRIRKELVDSRRGLK